jgi:phage-related protein
MSSPAGDGLVGDASIRVDANTDPAVLALARFSRDAQGRIRDVRGRFVADGTIINRSLISAAGGGDRFGGSLRSLASVAGSVGGILGKVGLTLGKVGAAAGTAAPLLAGIVTTLQNVAPAGAVAVTGMLAVTQASAAIKLGMVGVEEAVSSAFDTSEEGAKKFDEALKKLAPNARAFALQVRTLAPAFREFQQGVQNKLFTGLSQELGRLSTSVLPVLRKNINDTATTLNRMALGATGAARSLATSGTLGKAMAGANQGLANLQKTPGQVVTALGQLAAAGAPAFDRLTGAVADVATKISDRLSGAFKSGALEDAVNTAVDLLKDLGTVVSNVFGALGNILAPVQAAGGGLVGTLVEITGALKDATGTQAFQSAIGSLAGVMGTLARTVGPLLGQVLSTIAPIFIELGPPVERLITALGAGLSPIITGLRPVLAAAADALGVLIDAVSPLLPIVGNLIASLLPPLVPLLLSIGDVFAQAAPIVKLVADVLARALAPIFAQLPAIITPVANLLTMLAGTLFPVLAQVVLAIAPSLTRIGQSFGQLLAAVAPLLTILGELIGGVLVALLPLLTPIIDMVAQLAAVFADQLANALNNVVIPAVQLVTALLQGDASAAWQAFKDLLGGIVRYLIDSFKNFGRVIGIVLSTLLDVVKQLPGKIFAALSVLFGGLFQIGKVAWDRFKQVAIAGGLAVITFARSLPGRVRSALTSLGGLLATLASGALNRFNSAVRTGADKAIAFARGIPGKIRSGFGAVGGFLASAGRDLIRGMINGVKDMAGSLISAAKDVVGGAIDGAKSLLGISSPSKVFAEIGRDTGRGFINGLTGTRDQINRTATTIAASITKAFRGQATRTDDRLVTLVQQGNRRLQTLARERDRIAQQVAAAQKFAGDLTQRASTSFSLSSLAGQEGLSAGTIEAGLRRGNKAIRDFAKNIRALQAKGLSKGLLRQLLELGPEQGGALAQTLADQGKDYIKRINSLQGSVTRSSTALGKLGADALFDAGKEAGRGFLTGLRAQQKQIEQLMLSIAKGMQKAIRKALGIKSPSTVMAEVGRQSTLGLALGLKDRLPQVQQAVAALSSSVAGTAGNLRAGAPALTGVGALPVGASRTGTGGATVVNYNYNLNLTNRGVISSKQEFRDYLIRELDTLRRLNKLPTAKRGG